MSQNHGFVHSAWHKGFWTKAAGAGPDPAGEGEQSAEFSLGGAWRTPHAECDCFFKQQKCWKAGVPCVFLPPSVLVEKLQTKAASRLGLTLLSSPQHRPLTLRHSVALPQLFLSYGCALIWGFSHFLTWVCCSGPNK